MPVETKAWLAGQDHAKVEASLTKLHESRNSPRYADYFRGLGATDGYFALWMMLCDRRCTGLIGVGVFDIADWTWTDAYTDGMSPKEAVLEALRAEDTFSAMF